MTLREWHEYIATLTGAPLLSKCIAANTQRFADQLRAVGDPPLPQVLKLFVKQMLLTGMKIPEGGALDLHAMSRDIGPVVPLSEEVVVGLGVTHQEPRDGLEEALLTMELDEG